MAKYRIKHERPSLIAGLIIVVPMMAFGVAIIWPIKNAAGAAFLALWLLFGIFSAAVAIYTLVTGRSIYTFDDGADDDGNPPSESYSYFRAWLGPRFSKPVGLFHTVFAAGMVVVGLIAMITGRTDEDVPVLFMIAWVLIGGSISGLFAYSTFRKSRGPAMPFLAYNPFLEKVQEPGDHT